MGILEKQGKSITSFDYNNKEIADYIYSAINSTQFLGISVSVSGVVRTMSQCTFTYPSENRYQGY